MPSESKLRTELTNTLRRQNAVCIPYVHNKYSMPGVADFFCAHRLWHGWIETKVSGETLRPAQEQFICLMCERGVNCAVVVFQPYGLSVVAKYGNGIHRMFTCTQGSLIEMLAATRGETIG